MSVGWPSGLERACPKCGAVQESPGSTICEVCGTDLLRAAVEKLSSPRLAPRPRRHLEVGAYFPRSVVAILRRVISLVFRGIEVLQRIVFLAVRGAALVLLFGSLIIGLSFVPAVNARVPATKEVAATAKQWLRRAEDWASSFLPVLKPEAQPPRRTSPSAAKTQKPAPAKPVVTQPLTVKSTPSGATVRLNTRSVGKTPLTLKVAAGTYKVTISRTGYVTTTRTVIVKQGKAASVIVILVAPRP